MQQNAEAATLISASRCANWMESVDVKEIIENNANRPGGETIRQNFSVQRKENYGDKPKAKEENYGDKPKAKASELPPDVNDAVKYLNDQNENPYTILGVEVNASGADIKKAYNKAALKYHPDKLESVQGDRFKLANAAYKVLQNEEAKKMFPPPPVKNKLRPGH